MSSNGFSNSHINQGFHDSINSRIYNTNTSLGVGVYINTGTPAAPNWSSIQTFNSNTGVSIGKVVYNASSGDNTKVVSRGMFSFRIGGPSGASELQMKMNASPSSTINLYINEIEFGGNTNNISQVEYSSKFRWIKTWSNSHLKKIMKILVPYIMVLFAIYLLVNFRHKNKKVLNINIYHKKIITLLFLMIAFSIIWGAMYLPPEVLNISFLRSVIFKKPSESISPISPV